MASGKEYLHFILELMPAAICELPYEGAEEMLLVDEVDRKAFLTELFGTMYDELPLPKQKRKVTVQNPLH